MQAGRTAESYGSLQLSMATAAGVCLANLGSAHQLCSQIHPCGCIIICRYKMIVSSHHDALVSSQLVDKDGGGVGPRDGVHGIEAEGEVLAAHKLLQGGEVEDLLQSGQVVGHTVDHLHLHTTCDAFYTSNMWCNVLLCFCLRRQGCELGLTSKSPAFALLAEMNAEVLPTMQGQSRQLPNKA